MSTILYEISSNTFCVPCIFSKNIDLYLWNNTFAVDDVLFFLRHHIKSHRAYTKILRKRYCAFPLLIVTFLKPVFPWQYWHLVTLYVWILLCIHLSRSGRDTCMIYHHMTVHTCHTHVIIITWHMLKRVHTIKISDLKFIIPLTQPLVYITYVRVHC